MGRNGTPKRILKEELFLAPEESVRILEAAEALGLEWFVPLYLARYLALREVELVHLRVRDLRAELRKIFVWTAKNKRGAEPVGCGCGGYARNVAVRESMPARDDVVRVFLGWVEYKGISGDDWLFPSRKNRLRHLTTARIRQIFDECANRAGVVKIPQRGMHAFRHLVGSEVAEMTGDPFIVQRALRHGSISSGQAYVHVRGLEKVMDRLGRATDGP